VQVLSPRRSVYGLTAPRVASVGRLGALGVQSGTNFVSTVRASRIKPADALGPNAGDAVAGASLATSAARVAYTGYQLLTGVSPSDVDIYLDAGSGSDVGDADALVRQASAETTPAQKDRVSGAVEQAKTPEGKALDKKVVAAQASEIQATAKNPSTWDKFVENGEGIYAKCLRANAAGNCVKFGLDWKVIGGAFTGSATVGAVAYLIKNNKNVPAACLQDATSTACAVAIAQQERGDLANLGIPGASAPLPNPAREDVIQSWLDGIANAEDEDEVDAAIEAAKRLGTFTPEEMARLEDAAKKAKAKLASKRTMLYVGAGVGVVALVALIAAAAKRR
jgi:hypothetical protein